MNIRYQLDQRALALAEENSPHNMRSMALYKLNKKFKRPFTQQEAVDALFSCKLGSGTPDSFVKAFIKEAYMVKVTVFS